MKKIQETLMYKRLRSNLIGLLLAAVVLVIYVLLTKGNEEDIAVFLFALRLMLFLILAILVPFFLYYAYLIMRLKKLYNESTQFFRTKNFHLKEFWGKRSRNRCSIYIEENGVTYASPSIFRLLDISEIMNRTLVYIVDGERLYPLWAEGSAVEKN